MATIGVIGVGCMGLAIAQRLIERGHMVHACDIDPAALVRAVAAGAIPADDAAALASRCELVIVAVVDAGQTRDVLLGAAGRRGVIDADPRPRDVLLCPTIAPEDVEAAARALAAHGVGAIDAPMSGGPQRAREGRMSLMLAAEPGRIARWQAVLDDLASPCFVVGATPGMGARTKLVNNLLAAANLVAACDAMELAEAAGLDPALTLSVIERSSGQSWIGTDRARRTLAGDRHVAARLALLAKDSTLALAMARDVGVDSAVGRAAQQRLARACGDGRADDDDSTLWRRRPG